MEKFSERFPSEDFTRPLIEHFLKGTELLVRDLGKVSAFGQVVTDAPVLAFAGAAFPWAVWMAKEDLQAEIGGEGFVLRHFLALIVGEGFA